MLSRYWLLRGDADTSRSEDPNSVSDASRLSSRPERKPPFPGCASGECWWTVARRGLGYTKTRGKGPCKSQDPRPQLGNRESLPQRKPGRKNNRKDAPR